MEPTGLTVCDRADRPCAGGSSSQRSAAQATPPLVDFSPAAYILRDAMRRCRLERLAPTMWRRLLRVAASIVVTIGLVAPATHGQPVLYGTAGSDLYQIDALTGAATFIGVIEDAGGMDLRRCSALDADADGNLYAVCVGTQAPFNDELVLVLIDRSTAAASVVGALGLSVGQGQGLTDISFRSDGILFGYYRDSTRDFPLDRLVTIDLNTGAVTLDPFTNLDEIGNALAFGSFGMGPLFHGGGLNLNSLDTSIGSATQVCLLSFSSPAVNSPRLSAMDANPATDVIYAVVNDRASGIGSPSANYLATVDEITCEVSVIGPSVDGLDGLAWIWLPDLSLTKNDSEDPVLAGQEVTYTLTVENHGPDATGFSVTDTLPAATTLVATTGCLEDPNGVPTCTVASVASSGSVDITIVVQTSPSFNGILTNTASVTSAAADENTGNDTDSEETTVEVRPPVPVPVPALSVPGVVLVVLLLVGVARRALLSTTRSGRIPNIQ